MLYFNWKITPSKKENHFSRLSERVWALNVSLKILNLSLVVLIKSSTTTTTIREL